MTEKKIFIAAHKQFTPPDSSIYFPLQVGAEGKKNLGYLKDNTGDHISEKNANYCELTGLYWIWKNVNSDVVGLVHYRRYFYNSILHTKHILSEDEMNQCLKNYDVIIAQRGYTGKQTVYEDYYTSHTPSDIEIVRDVIAQKTPFYFESFQKVMKSHCYSQFNMMICRKEIFDAYCEWLFEVLFETEKRLLVPLENRTSYEARVFGFLSERLLVVWLNAHPEYKVCEKPVFNTEENLARQKTFAAIKKLLPKF